MPKGKGSGGSQERNSATETAAQNKKRLERERIARRNKA